MPHRRIARVARRTLNSLPFWILLAYVLLGAGFVSWIHVTRQVAATEAEHARFEATIRATAISTYQRCREQIPERGALNQLGVRPPLHVPDLAECAERRDAILAALP